MTYDDCGCHYPKEVTFGVEIISCFVNHPFLRTLFTWSATWMKFGRHFPYLPHPFLVASLCGILLSVKQWITSPFYSMPFCSFFAIFDDVIWRTNRVFWLCFVTSSISPLDILVMKTFLISGSSKFINQHVMVLYGLVGFLGHVDHWGYLMPNSLYKI